MTDIYLVLYVSYWMLRVCFVCHLDSYFLGYIQYVFGNDNFL